MNETKQFLERIREAKEAARLEIDTVISRVSDRFFSETGLNIEGVKITLWCRANSRDITVDIEKI
jgi:hypothetical protein